jgi:hypothetical protein
MRRWRQKKNPETQKAADLRRLDERRTAELRARAYIWSYLRRGRIVAPTTCDVCGRERLLWFYHPDPEQKRLIVWLCEEHRKTVRANQIAVVRHWDWPGHLEPPPTAPRWARFTATPEQHERATRAAAAVSRLGAATQRIAYVSAFFAEDGPAVRRAVLGAGLRALRANAPWTPYGNPEIDQQISLWVRDELARFEHERRAAEPRRDFEEEEAPDPDRQMKPRYTPRKGRRKDITTIGSVAVPPAAAPRPASGTPARTLDDTILDEWDARLAEHDRFMADFATRLKAGLPSTRDREEKLDEPAD